MDEAPSCEEELAAYRRLQLLDVTALAAMSTDDLLVALRDAELVHKAAPRWSGYLAGTLRCRGRSWSKLVELTGMPQTTLHQRVHPRSRKS